MRTNGLNIALVPVKFIDSAIQCGLKQPMNNDIGIPANRTSKVCIIRNIECKVLPFFLIEVLEELVFAQEVPLLKATEHL